MARHISNPRQKGFTLIELLLVVIVIGIIAALVLPKFADIKEGAYVDAMKNDLRNLATAQELYAEDNGAYSSSVASIPGFALSSDVSALVLQASGAESWVALFGHEKTDQACMLSIGSSGTRPMTCQEPGDSPLSPSDPTPAAGDPVTFTIDQLLLLADASGLPGKKLYAADPSAVRAIRWSFSDARPAQQGVFATHSTITETFEEECTEYGVVAEIEMNSGDVETGFASVETECSGGGGGGGVPMGAPPVADFSIAPSSVEVGSSMSFDATGTTGTGLTYAWDFGDGATGSGVQTTHTYASAGTYSVDLTVTDQWGQSHAATQSAAVTAPAADSLYVVITPTDAYIQVEDGSPGVVLFDAWVQNSQGQIQLDMPVSIGPSLSINNYQDFGTFSSVTDNGAGTYSVTATYSDASMSNNSWVGVTATAVGATGAGATVHVECSELAQWLGVCS